MPAIHHMVYGYQGVVAFCESLARESTPDEEERLLQEAARCEYNAAILIDVMKEEDAKMHKEPA